MESNALARKQYFGKTTLRKSEGFFFKYRNTSIKYGYEVEITFEK